MAIFQLPNPTPAKGLSLISMMVLFHIFRRSLILAAADELSTEAPVRLAALCFTCSDNTPSLSAEIKKLIIAALIAIAAKEPMSHFFLLTAEKLVTSNAATIKNTRADNHAERVCDMKTEITMPAIASEAAYFQKRPALYKTNTTKGIKNTCADPKKLRLLMSP